VDGRHPGNDARSQADELLFIVAEASLGPLEGFGLDGID
jgi:hypothetical protein